MWRGNQRAYETKMHENRAKKTKNPMPFDFLTEYRKGEFKMTQKSIGGGYSSPEAVKRTAQKNYITVK